MLGFEEVSETAHRAHAHAAAFELAAQAMHRDVEAVVGEARVPGAECVDQLLAVVTP